MKSSRFHLVAAVGLVLGACGEGSPAEPLKPPEALCECEASFRASLTERFRHQRHVGHAALNSGVGLGLGPVKLQLAELVRWMRDRTKQAPTDLYEGCTLVRELPIWFEREQLKLTPEGRASLSEATRICEAAGAVAAQSRDTCGCAAPAHHRLVGQISFEQQLVVGLIPASLRVGDFLSRAARQLEERDTLSPDMVAELLSVVREVRLGAVTTITTERDDPRQPACELYRPFLVLESLGDGGAVADATARQELLRLWRDLQARCKK